MAYNNQEIELKIKLSKTKFQEILDKLHKLGKFVKFSHHIDDYYTPVHGNFLEAKYPFEWLAIRRRDEKVLLNYKHWYPENAKYTTHCDEYETEIISPVQLKMILKALNFRKFVSVVKKRNVFLYKDGLEIALDEVKDLGYFVEVEAVKDFGSLKNARKAIFIFTKSMGLTETKTVPGGYASELMRRRRLAMREKF